MKSMGNEIFVAAREKELTTYLLDKYEIPYHLLSAHRKPFIGKSIEFLFRWWRTWLLCREIKPDIALGLGDFYLAQAGKVSSFQSIFITDTESAKHDRILSFPFADHILTPACFGKKLKKQTFFNSYKELAYLGRKRFVPDPGVLDLLGLEKGQPYVVVRFTDQAAVHDLWGSRLGWGLKALAVEKLAFHARVFVSSEEELPPELQKYLLPCAPEHIHHVLYYADLLYGESATMASEAACLGTPAVFIDDQGRGYTNEQEKRYGLVFNYSPRAEDYKQSIAMAEKIITEKKSSGIWRLRRNRLLNEKEDMTDFLVDFVLKRKG